MQKKITDDMRKVNNLLANCNRNFVIWPLSHQKNALTLSLAFKRRKISFDAIIDILLTFKVLKS